MTLILKLKWLQYYTHVVILFEKRAQILFIKHALFITVILFDNDILISVF